MRHLIRVIHDALAARSHCVPVATRLQSGFIGCQMYRELGMSCDGLLPFLLTRREVTTVHGENERISVENLREEIHCSWEVVSRRVGEVASP